MERSAPAFEMIGLLTKKKGQLGLIVALLFIVLPYNSIAQTYDAYSMDSFKVESQALDTSWNNLIATPPGFDTTTKNLPIVLVMDGHYLSFPTIGTLNFYNMNFYLPECYVVGIGQINRGKELKGSLSDNFREYIFEELLPEVQNRTNSNGGVIMIGHSFSADFLLDCLGYHDRITGMIAISPYLGEERISSFCDSLKKSPISRFSIYTSKDDFKRRFRATKALDSILEEKGIPHGFKVFPGRDHYSNFTVGMEEGLKYTLATFRAFSERDAAFIANDSLSVQEALSRIEEKHEKDWNTPLIPKYFNINEMYGWLRIEGIQNERLLEFLDLLIKKPYSDLSLCATHYLKGELHEEQEEYAKALSSYEHSYEMAPEENFSNTEQFTNKIEKMKKKLKEHEDQ